MGDIYLAADAIKSPGFYSDGELEKSHAILNAKLVCGKDWAVTVAAWKT